MNIGKSVRFPNRLLPPSEGPKKGKFQDFHDFRVSGGPERPPNAPAGSGVTARVLLTSGNRFPIDYCRHSFQKLIFHSEIGSGGCARAKNMLYDIVQKAQHKVHIGAVMYQNPAK